MENLNWTNFLFYQDDYVQKFIAKADAIKAEKGDAAVPQDFNCIDLIRPNGHNGIEKLYTDYQIDPSFKVLDVGIGFGGTSRYLYSVKGHNDVFGFDYVQGLVNGSVHINKLLNIEDKVKHTQGDACTYPLEPNSFDLAIVIGVFVHIDSPEAIANTCRALKPGALFYDEDYYFVKERADFNDNDRFIINNRHMYGTKTRAELTEALEANNMEILEMSEFGYDWSEGAWTRAEQLLRTHKDGTYPLSEEHYNQYVVISTQVACDLNHYTMDQLREKFPNMCATFDVEDIVFKRPKLSSVIRVVARKRA